MQNVKDFMIENGYVSVIKNVRKNSNDYPFITFMKKDNVAENIYFSKNAAQKVSEGQEIAKGFFNDFLITTVENAEKEVRIKIALKGETLRLEIDDLF